MEILIAIAAAVVIIGIISVFFLVRPRKSRGYGRMGDEDDYIPTEPAPVERPQERPVPRQRPPAIKNTYGGTSSVASLMGGFRALIGLAAVVTLIIIFNSTRETLKSISDVAPGSLQVVQVYAEGIFKALITIGIALALYIFSRFTHH